MPTFFLDTSALVKRYASERGTQWIQGLCDPASGNLIAISQATRVETVAAFCRKALNQDPKYGISIADRDHMIALFRRDLQRGYGIVPVTDSIYTAAGDLCMLYRLHAYDAVQLACALALRNVLAQQSIQLTLVTGDQELDVAARAERLVTDNPEKHP